MFKKEKTKIAIKVVNIVASATLGQEVNLNAVVKAFPTAEFPYKRFPGLVFKLKKPKTTALIFRSGEMICTGGRSENETRKAVKSIVRKLSKRGMIIPKRSKVKIENIISSANFGRNVDLNSVSKLQRTIYEPDQFPALIYRMHYPKVAFLIFSTGRLICVGAKSRKEVHRAIGRLFQKLKTVKLSKSPSFQRPNRNIETKYAEYIPIRRIELRDFILPGLRGKTCIYVPGLWCHNKCCNGPPCKFTNLIQRRVANGFPGCWGFHWQKGWHTTETKKLQRKFYD